MLLFDLTAAQGWGTTKQHGGGKYAEIVFEALCKSGVRMMAMWDPTRWISDFLLELCEKYSVKMEDVSKNSLDKIVNDNHVSCIYSAFPEKDLLAYTGCRIIATLHGLRKLEMPVDWMTLKYPHGFLLPIKLLIKKCLPEKMLRRRSYNMYRKYFKNEKISLVTVSNHTKYAIGTYFPEVDVEKIMVCYSPSTSNPIRAERNTTHPPYFLLVSANREEKNALRAMMALDQFLDRHDMKAFQVKITGIGENIFKYRLRHPENFVFCGYVDDMELNSLYANAYALVYPSLTEGFGYPPLEAMRYGVPVIASSFTSISEVCGDAALYFNPFSVNEMTNRILQISNEEIYAAYAEKALRRYEEVTCKQNSDLVRLVEYIVNSGFDE